MKNYLKLLRVEQWVKNTFVFIPLFFAGMIFNKEMLLESIFSFIVFSLTASSIYIVNDYSDIEADRKHPEKCKRPLASGAISKSMAKIILATMLVGVCTLIIGGQVIFQQDLSKFGIIIIAYFIMNLAYTFKLKHIAIVDISIIAVGFVLRVLAGGYATGIVVSQWAIILTFVLALVLAVGKRRGELINAQLSGKTRKALDGYNVQFADILLSIAITLAVVSYLMFTISPEAQRTYTNKVFYTFVFVIFAFLRYLQQTLVYNKTESPTKMIYKDRYIQITLMLWALSFLVLKYFND